MFSIERRHTKIFIIKTKSKVIKIPYTFNSWGETQEEKFLIQKVRKDPIFSPHLLNYKYIFGCSVTDRLPHLKAGENKPVEEYFKKAFRGLDKWEKKPLRYLLDADYFLDFISAHSPDSHHLFLEFLNTVELPRASSHGDFHRRNILTKDDKLYFIDWSRYKENSSRYFDLLDFYVYYKGRKYESWTQVWERQYSQISDYVLGINLPSKVFLAYGIWRVVEELGYLAARNALDKYKHKKYAKFISVLAEKIRESALEK